MSSPLPEQIQEHPVHFTGVGGEYFRIWIVNLLLVIITLGLYAPWAKVRRLRYFYSHTHIAGHSLDFHGDPKRMLRGYVLVGFFFLAYQFAGKLSAIAGVIAVVCLLAIWPLLFKSAMKFRMANTSWRGLRFRFIDDGAWPSYKVWLLPMFLLLVPSAVASLFAKEIDERIDGKHQAEAAQAAAQSASASASGAHQPGIAELGALPPPPNSTPMPAITGPDATVSSIPTEIWVAVGLFLFLLLLFLALAPWFYWRLKEYQHNRYAFGQLRTRFITQPRQMFGLMVKVFLLNLGLVLLMLSGPGLIAIGALSGGQTWELLAVTIGSLLIFIMMPVIVLLYTLPPAYWTARSQNIIWSGTGNREFRFISNLRFAPYFKLQLKNYLVILFTLGLYRPFATIDNARMKLQAITLKTRFHLDDLVNERVQLHKDAAGDMAADLFGMDFGF